MALPWFRMYAEFAGDPVVQSLAFEDQRHYIMLLCLKCAGTLDRDIANARKELIICRGLGLDAASAAEAKRRLIEVGLIDKNWQPSGWDKRQFSSDVSSERVRKHRKNKDSGNVSETKDETECNSFGNAPDTDTDTDTEKDKNTSAEQSPSAPSAQDDFVIALPAIGGKDYHVTQSQSAEWGTLFPAVDVPQELRAMRAWLLANPSRRKTLKGVPRFATSWLGRKQDKGGSEPRSGRSTMFEGAL